MDSELLDSVIEYLPNTVIYGALLLFFVDKILQILKGRGIDFSKIGVDTAELTDMLTTHIQNSKLLEEQVQEMYKWHNVDDPSNPGVKIWWQNQQVAKTLVELSVGIGKLVELLSAVSQYQKDIRREISNLKE
jgi:hypothetical protein